MTTPINLPASTYRVQLNSSFTFSDAASIADYLDSLGVTDCYISPPLAARSGSTHGYDVTDPTRLNSDLGGNDGFRSFAQALQQRGMKILLDVVPNHMCIADRGNWWWQDVMENGPSSPYARFFDIAWNPLRENMRDKVLLPILGDQYGRVLEGGQIRIHRNNGVFTLVVCDQMLPVAPRTWTAILEPALALVKARSVQSDPHVMELESIITALSYLPPRNETDEARVRERQREKEVIKRRLSALVSESAPIEEAISRTVQLLNGRRDDPTSLDALEALLASQPYRLSYWRVAADEINYRRFFDINDLAAIRVEDPAVFSAVHEQVLQLVHEGFVGGLRIDHADGLFDPVQYFLDLQNACAAVGCSQATGPVADGEKPFYLVAEKILLGDELLRPDWAIYGTTGYGFLNMLNGLFVDPGSRPSFLRFYSRFTGLSQTFGDVVYDAKQLIARFALASELNVLSHRLDDICQQHRHSRDFTLENLRFALLEVIASFPVYRTYIRPNQSSPDEEDHRHIMTATRAAKERNPATTEEVFDLIASVLLLEDPPGLSPQQINERHHFVLRFQQLTGSVMAKGLEDTAFYRYFPLASLNEVGGDPEDFGVTPSGFHERTLKRTASRPHGLLATSTHDTKRSEDVRARINALSEIPAKWQTAVRTWHNLLRSKRTRLADTLVPDKNTEYLLFQTLVGTWPLQAMDERAHRGFVLRIQDYMEKASKEAKLHTSWVNPHEGYDPALRRFIERVLENRPENRFLSDIVDFQKPVAWAGMLNSLSQTLLKIAAPGVPDTYQGTELWALTLVDPDNRGSVDYSLRREMLAGLDRAEAENREGLVSRLKSEPFDGATKLYITSRALRLRRRLSDLFTYGAYRPIHPRGERDGHVVAFAREHGSQIVIAAAGRFYLKLGVRERMPDARDWGDTSLLLDEPLRPLKFRDVFTGLECRPEGRELPLRKVFSVLPVALLVSSPE
jgi:(1->4)-alpha-D-glucan 1-alpha-D-glucosylmutase